jgi:hypothetical protein
MLCTIVKLNFYSETKISHFFAHELKVVKHIVLFTGEEWIFLAVAIISALNGNNTNMSKMHKLRGFRRKGHFKFQIIFKVKNRSLLKVTSNLVSFILIAIFYYILISFFWRILSAKSLFSTAWKSYIFNILRNPCRKWSGQYASEGTPKFMTGRSTILAILSL